MLPQSAFDPPPLSAAGDKDANLIFIAMGRALVAWEAVELQLASLYGALLGVSYPAGARRAYGAIATFNGRSAMLMEAAEALFHHHPNSELHSEVKTLVNKVCKKAAARRNEIAHGMLSGGQDDKPGESTFMLSASFYSSLKRDNDFKPSYEFNSERIFGFVELYGKLLIDIQNVVEKVIIWQQSIPLPGHGS